MTTVLSELEPSTWFELRDLYKEHTNKSSSYYMLQSFINWIEKNPALNLKIYVFGNIWQTDGTFIAVLDILNQPQYSHVFCNTLNENLTNLRNAFANFPNKKPYCIHGFPVRLMDAITQHFDFCGFKNFEANPTKWYHLPKKEAEKLTIVTPPGITLAPVDPIHIKHINSIWPHRSPGSEAFIEHLIEYNVSMGAYDTDGKLLAWCLQLPLGSLGVLQVEDAHRRKGYGNLLVRCMPKKLCEKNYEVMAPVVPTNVASSTMFDKLGFEVIDKAYWTMKPNQINS